MEKHELYTLLNNRDSVEELQPWDWTDLLEHNPEFIDFIEYEWPEYCSQNGSFWSGRLAVYPEHALYCPWNQLSTVDWLYLLDVTGTRFADRCDWGMFSGDDWEILLVGCCDHPELGQFDGNLDFAKYCDWNRLSGSNWDMLLPEHPEFACRCPWVNPLGNGLTVSEESDLTLPVAIVKNPSLLEREDVQERFKSLLTVKRNGPFYQDSLESSAIFNDTCECLGGVNPWAFLLYYRPELADKCTTFEMFSGKSRCLLLARQPQLADRWSMEELASRRFGCWRCIRDDDSRGVDFIFKSGWDVLVTAQPQFAKWLNASPPSTR